MKHYRKSIALITALIAGFTSTAFAANEEAQCTAGITADKSYRVDRIDPYIERGSYRIWVTRKLGRPELRAGDRTWVYPVNDPTGENTRDWRTVITFDDDGRVSDILLVSTKAKAPHTGDSIATLD